MAHTKSGGSTRLGRDSESKRLGVKIHNGQKVKIGNIIVKQRGTHWYAGRNVKQGKDDSIFALKNGIVQFTKKSKKTFDGKKKLVSVVNVQETQ